MAIRVRGISDVTRGVRETLQILRLNRNCHAVLMDDRPSNVGMLRKVRNCITWGGISDENVALLIRERGRLVGDQKLTDQYAKEIGYKSLDDLIDAICKFQVHYNELPKAKPVFRLHPPKKGFKGKIKKSYVAGGVTGHRGGAINDLLKRMM